MKDRLTFYKKRQVFESNVYQLKILIPVHNKTAPETSLELQWLLQYKHYIERFLFCFKIINQGNQRATWTGCPLGSWIENNDLSFKKKNFINISWRFKALDVYWLFFQVNQLVSFINAKREERIVQGMLRPIFCIDINTHSDRKWKNL